MDDAKKQQGCNVPEEKKPYETPEIKVVPIQIEERLLGCGKMQSNCSGKRGKHDSGSMARVSMS
jgi:hypothetical protein